MAKLGSLTEFHVQALIPYDIAHGPDGNLWFTADGLIGSITPDGAVAEFPLPAGVTGVGFIAAGPDGNLWFTSTSSPRIGRITTSGAITMFDVPGPPSAIATLAPGPDGHVWFTDWGSNRIGSIGPTGTVDMFDVPSGPPPLSGPFGIVAGPDGNLWFTREGGALGRITPNGAVTDFPLPAPQGAYFIASGPDGNLWFTRFPGTIGRMTPQGILTEFGVPSSGQPNPLSIVAGPDGNLWFTEWRDGGAFPPKNARVGRITPEGTVTEFVLPTIGPLHKGVVGPDENLWFTRPAYPGAIVRLVLTPPPVRNGTMTEFLDDDTEHLLKGKFGITTGADGNLWFTAMYSNAVGRITPEGVVTAFPLPTADSAPRRIAAGPDGNLWFTGAHGIGRITPSGDVTHFSDQRPTFDIAAGPDGNLWFTDPSLSRIVRLTPDGDLIEYEVPPPLKGQSIQWPLAITAGPDGNLWFTDRTNRIGRITPGGTINQFPLPSVGGPASIIESIVAGPDGCLWFIERSATVGSMIGRMTTAGAVTEFQLPTAQSIPVQITLGADGNLWFTQYQADLIGRITPEGTITDFPTPTPTDPLAITAGPDGNLWFTWNDGIGLVELAPEVAFSPSSLTFASETVGVASPAETVVIGNTGGRSLGIKTVATAGANPAEFLIASEGCSGVRVPPGQSCSVEVRFVPGRVGPRAANLRLDDDAFATPHVLDLSGTGSHTADLAISIEGTPTPVRTGKQLTYLVTVSNFGPQDARSVVVDHTLPSASQFVSAAIAPVGPGAGATFPAVRATGTLTYPLGTLVPGAAVAITVVVTVTAPTAATIQTVATVSSSDADPTTANNAATTSVYVD